MLKFLREMIRNAEYETAAESFAYSNLIATPLSFCCVGFLLMTLSCPVKATAIATLLHGVGSLGLGLFIFHNMDKI